MGYSDESDMNITLHQSYEAEGDPLYEISNVSDTTNNTFSVKSPKDNYFNSTFTNITIRDIYAPNKTVVVEDDLSMGRTNFGTPGDRIAGSFTVPSDCILVNFSVDIANAAGTNSDIRVHIFNNSFAGGVNKPNETVGTYANNVAFDISFFLIN